MSFEAAFCFSQGDIESIVPQFVVMIAIQLLLALTSGVVFTVTFMLISNSVYREVLGTCVVLYIFSLYQY